jgi:hypothetical protein
MTETWPLESALRITGRPPQMIEDFIFKGRVKGTRRAPESSLPSYCYRHRLTREWIWLRTDSSREECEEELSIALSTERAWDKLFDELAEFKKTWPPPWLTVEGEEGI